MYKRWKRQRSKGKQRSKYLRGTAFKNQVSIGVLEGRRGFLRAEGGSLFNNKKGKWGRIWIGEAKLFRPEG